MELKQPKGEIHRLTAEAFNRTSVELKRAKALTSPTVTVLTFNRTSVELKRSSNLEGLYTCNLLIEPVWN